MISLPLFHVGGLLSASVPLCRPAPPSSVAAHVSVRAGLGRLTASFPAPARHRLPPSEPYTYGSCWLPVVFEHLVADERRTPCAGRGRGLPGARVRGDGERTIHAVAIRRRLPGLSREGNHRVRLVDSTLASPRPIARDSNRALHRLGERIVAAGIEDDEAQLLGVAAHRDQSRDPAEGFVVDIVSVSSSRRSGSDSWCRRAQYRDRRIEHRQRSASPASRLPPRAGRPDAYAGEVPMLIVAT